jgi:hypothetical protein
MGTLTLTRAGKSRDGEWSTDDYDVFEGSRLIGHIVLTTQGPQGGHGSGKSLHGSKARRIAGTR